MSTWLPNNPRFLGAFAAPVFTPEECDLLIEGANAASTWRPAGVYGEEGDRIDPAVRSVEGVGIDGDADTWPLNVLISAITAANDNWYLYDLEVIPVNDRPSILRYDATSADHFRSHTDAGGGSPTRKLTFTVQLSDPRSYVGCDLIFTGDGRRAPRDQGTMIVFPSYTYHHVTPILSGCRYAIVGWVHGPTFS